MTKPNKYKARVTFHQRFRECLYWKIEWLAYDTFTGRWYHNHLFVHGDLKVAISTARSKVRCAWTLFTAQTGARAS